jgi:hypothetical protein
METHVETLKTLLQMSQQLCSETGGNAKRESLMGS